MPAMNEVEGLKEKRRKAIKGF